MRPLGNLEGTVLPLWAAIPHMIGILTSAMAAATHVISTCFHVAPEVPGHPWMRTVAF